MRRNIYEILWTADSMDERKRNEDWTNVLKKEKNENGTHERFD